MSRQFRVFYLSRQTLFAVLGVVVISGILLVLSRGQILPTLGTLKTGQATVIIDPGHGGVDSGAVYGELLEKDINLDVALQMRDYLVQKGIGVEVTREQDVDLGGELTKGRHRRDLDARLKVINRGRVAVSIHVNTIGDPAEEGAVVLYPRGSNTSQQLAEQILKELGKVQKLNYNQAIPRDNLYLLRRAEIPMVLVELGFISNAQDRSKLTNKTFKQKCAQAIAQGIVDFLDNLD